jgi:hypothetical protein
MNTVMDDNKMLTLASNERIPLTPTMRLLLEINHMNHCSPATVSRGGVIFVNAEDVGWKPVVDSWIEKLEVRGCCNQGCMCATTHAGSGCTHRTRMQTLAPLMLHCLRFAPSAADCVAIAVVQSAGC